jgi:uncharacterized SAM-binding protein YcdF (DUF218 family)
VIKWLLGIIAVWLVLIFGIAIYLSPDDLAKCSERPSAGENCHAADVIVAISGGDTAARAGKAVALYQNGWAKRIIFSGAAADPESPSNAEQMRDIALRAGVPASAIILEPAANNTEENARNVAKILSQNGWRDVILTTSPYHLRRAKLLFESATRDLSGATIRTAAATDSGYDQIWWLTPMGWWRELVELGGIGKFYLTVTKG